jgi:hypothetical protein
MRIPTLLSHVLGIGFLLTLGCASTNAIENLRASDAPLPPFDTIVVETASDVSGTDKERNLLQFTIVSGLTQSGKFGQVEVEAPADTTPHLTVTARIKDLYGVSDLARLLVGAFAGRASIAVDVDVRDRPDGDPIETFTAIGKSSGGWTGAGGTDQAVQRAGERIVNQILERRS